MINLGKGDLGRLEYILDMLTTGRVLPFSDQKYLDNIIPLYLGGEDVQSTNEHAQLQKEMQNLNHRLTKLERKGFEKYVGTKTVFFFVTVFVGWHALQVYVTEFLNMFLPTTPSQYVFPLNLVENYINYPIISFVFVAMMYAWVFIGFIHLARLIRTRKISN